MTAASARVRTCSACARQLTPLRKMAFTAKYLVAFQVPHLDLQQGQVPQDLDVLGVKLERVPVALDGLVILLV